MQPRLSERPSRPELPLTLERAQGLLAVFQQTLGHDLPNHLIAVQGLAQVLELEEGDRLSPAGRDLLARLAAAAGRAHGLVSTLADIGRVGRELHPPESLVLSELGREVAAEVNQLFPRRRIEYDFAHAQVPIRAPRVPVRRLLVQVIRCALAAAPEEAPVAVALGACATTSGQEFWVAYQGALGCEALRPMQDFFAGRTDAAPTGSLGLVLIRRLVEHLEGSISLEAVPGTGAVFTIALDR